MLKKNIYAALAVIVMVVLAFTAAVGLARLEPVDITPLAVTGPAFRENASGPVVQANQTADKFATQSPLRSEQGVQDAVADESSLAARDHAAPAFNADAIFIATQAVRVDAQGNVVLDHDTMVLLQNTLGQQDLQMDEVALAELKDLVEYAMPGSAGAQVAMIAGNYYEYLRAKAAYEELANDAGQADDYEDRQRQLQLLRETYLGAEVASRLFAQTDAENELMRASMALAADVSLSDEERQHQRVAINQEYVERVLSANGWSHRYQQFVEQKQALLAASGESRGMTDGSEMIDDVEAINNSETIKNRETTADTEEPSANNEVVAANREAQQQAITELWHTHFTAEEREKMMALQIPVL